MESKLTLKLDTRVIKRAKKIAAERNRSLSSMVEQFFRQLPEDIDDTVVLSPIVRELSGILTAEQLSDLDYRSYLEKKYE